MIIVGLTGGIGTGKSVVAEVWAEQGATVLTADTYGHQVLAANGRARRELAETFGEDIFTASGQPDRKRIAERAFASPEATRRLNEIIGKPLVGLLHADVQNLRRSKSGVLVVDAALICEWQSAIPFDFRVLVTAPRELRLKWLAARGLSREQALARMRVQWPDSRKRIWADVEIRNDGSLRELRQNALRVWDKIPERH